MSRAEMKSGPERADYLGKFTWPKVGKITWALTLDLEQPRDVSELLAHVFPDPLERTTAAALSLLRFVADLAAG